MFVQHKKLTHLQVPVDRVLSLQLSSGSVQLTLGGFPPQLCRSYLIGMKQQDKRLVLIAFYLIDSGRSVIYVPRDGAVPKPDFAPLLEEGLAFIETMGFIMTESDFPRLSGSQRQALWEALPVCQPPNVAPPSAAAAESSPAEQQAQQACAQSRESLGRLLASL